MKPCRKTSDKFRHFLALSVLFILPTAWASHPVLTLSADHNPVNPIANILVLEDPTGDLSLSTIQRPEIQSQFKPHTDSGTDLNFGFTRSTTWMKLELQAPGTTNEWILEVPYLNLNQISFYAPHQKPITLGTALPSDKKPIFYPFYAFPLTVNTQPQTFYLRASSEYALTVPIKLWERTAFTRHATSQTVVQFLYFGGLLGLMLYNFLLFLSLRNRSYLFYTLFAIAMGLGMLAGNGYGRLYLWPASPLWDTIAQTTFFGASGALAIMFASSFLRTKSLTPKLHMGLTLLAWGYAVSAAGLPISLWMSWPPGLFFQANFLLTVPACLMVFYAGFRIYTLGYQSALYLLIAWGCLWSGALIAVLRSYELLPSNPFTLYSLQIGSCLEMLLLSFALAHRIQSEKNRRIQTQTDLLAAREQVLALSQKNEKRLEERVQARTQKLQQAVLDEQTVRQAYVRFGAMISHEFRNPLNILTTQADLILRERKAGIDKLNVRVNSIQAAGMRLLRLFEQWLKNDRLQASITQPLMTTFTLSSLVHAIMHEVANYHSQRQILPPEHLPNVNIHGDRSLIEIAVFNLIDNAVKYSPVGTPIKIECLFAHGECTISVIDDGPGVPLDNPELVFDPHYRMAAHAAIDGNGLGLAFVRTVCDMHGTRARVENLDGTGCRFTIGLPAITR